MPPTVAAPTTRSSTAACCTTGGIARISRPRRAARRRGALARQFVGIATTPDDADSQARARRRGWRSVAATATRRAREASAVDLAKDDDLQDLYVVACALEAGGDASWRGERARPHPQRISLSDEADHPAADGARRLIAVSDVEVEARLRRRRRQQQRAGDAAQRGREDAREQSSLGRGAAALLLPPMPKSASSWPSRVGSSGIASSVTRSSSPRPARRLASATASMSPPNSSTRPRAQRGVARPDVAAADGVDVGRRHVAAARHLVDEATVEVAQLCQDAARAPRRCTCDTASRCRRACRARSSRA